MLHERSCYLYSGLSLRKSFPQAQRHCQRRHATLTSLLQPSEEAFAVRLAGNQTSFWIGLVDQSTDEAEVRYVWTDGHSLAGHSHWRGGEPSRQSLRHSRCVQADHSGWALASAGCASTKLPFICKKQG